ncbi:MAG: hypothetical protein HY716_13095 [Planctomycetes bacterium]|nr:hypothetical protein [Planctomycetota bacterium]
MGSQEPSARDAVERALEETARAPYAYRVTGRFVRTGAYAPPDRLVARIDKYVSARCGPLILVKGPEGLWKTPDERIGEQVEKPEKDIADIVKALEEAQPPHELIQEFLEMARPGHSPEARDVNGMACHLYAFSFREDPLRTSIEKQMDTSAARGAFRRPDKVLWGTAKGLLRVYLHRSEGTLIRFVEERSVKLVYGDETRIYKLEMQADFSEHGTAALDLPQEVRERLKMK